MEIKFDWFNESNGEEGCFIIEAPDKKTCMDQAEKIFSADDMLLMNWYEIVKQ
jgi:hypothetical protein